MTEHIKANRRSYLGIATALILLVALLSSSFPSLVLAQFTSAREWGGLSTGTAGVQSLTIANWRRDIGVPARFIVGANLNNVGPTTMNISSTGPTSIVRMTQSGFKQLVGGELFNGNIAELVYNGAVYILQGRFDIVGSTIAFRGASVPSGYLIEDGSCVSQTTYAALFAEIGTTYGSCSAGFFKLPDSRGSMLAGLDNQGSTGAANRLTSAGSGCTATALTGTGCGSQSSTLTSTDQLPPYTPSFGSSVIGVSFASGTIGVSFASSTITISVVDVRTFATGSVVKNDGGGLNPTGAGGPAWSPGASPVSVTGGSIGGSFNQSALSGSFDQSSLGGSFNQNALTAESVGASAAFATVSPLSLVRFAIKL
jgi:microcystin-dependent protein